LQLNVKIIEMRSTEKLLLILLLVFTFQANSFAHSLLLKDSVPGNNDKQWISPAVIFASGGAIAGIPALRKIEKSVYDGFNPTRKLTSIDDYTQYVPAAAVFAMDAAGLKGKNKPQQQFLLYALGNVTAAVIVQPMKRIIGRARPNKSDFHSFPSGHTSTAFVAAEFLHQEYGHYSPWISIAGYATAATTGYLRLYNNQHWLGDVLAGAAIGMASTKFIYWMNGKIKEKKKTAAQAF
jgi:membrane-associated phospholipid phosphatase